MVFKANIFLIILCSNNRNLHPLKSSILVSCNSPLMQLFAQLPLKSYFFQNILKLKCISSKNSTPSDNLQIKLRETWDVSRCFYTNILRLTATSTNHQVSVLFYSKFDWKLAMNRLKLNGRSVFWIKFSLEDGPRWRVHWKNDGRAGFVSVTKKVSNFIFQKYKE